MKPKTFAFFAPAAIAWIATGKALAATIVSDPSLDYPRLTARASGGAFQEDFSASDTNVGTLTAVSEDNRPPTPRANSAFVAIDRQLTDLGVSSTHVVILDAEITSGSVSASVTDQFLIQSDIAVTFRFQADVQATLAPSAGIGREASFKLSNEETGQTLFSYRWLYINEAIFGLPNPTLTPSFSILLEPGTYKFEAYLFDATSYFGQSATTTRFDYSFSIPEPTAMGGIACALTLFLARRKRPLNP